MSRNSALLASLLLCACGTAHDAVLDDVPASVQRGVICSAGDAVIDVAQNALDEVVEGCLAAQLTETGLCPRQHISCGGDIPGKFSALIGLTSGAYVVDGKVDTARVASDLTPAREILKDPTVVACIEEGVSGILIGGSRLCPQGSNVGLEWYETTPDSGVPMGGAELKCE